MFARVYLDCRCGRYFILYMLVGVVAGCGLVTNNSQGILELRDEIVEIACGECQFDVHGDDCHLAMRFREHCYFIHGSDIDDHGDAHAPDGLCNCIRLARVSGEIVGELFHASQVDLLPLR